MAFKVSERRERSLKDGRKGKRANNVLRQNSLSSSLVPFSVLFLSYVSIKKNCCEDWVESQKFHLQMPIAREESQRQQQEEQEKMI